MDLTDLQKLTGKFILDGHEPVLVDDLIEWGKWFESTDRHVALDEISGLHVSTVFLGISHGMDNKGRPILFETMVYCETDDPDISILGFEKKHEWYENLTNRYATWDEAEAGHIKMVNYLAKHYAKVQITDDKSSTTKKLPKP